MGAVDGKIVGLRYYSGFATVGEVVVSFFADGLMNEFLNKAADGVFFQMIQREPSNPYDANAIRVNNVHGNQIGHIPKNLAAKLAPYMVFTI